MMRKARLEIREVNVELDGPGYYLVPVAAFLLRTFSLAEEYQVNENA